MSALGKVRSRIDKARGIVVRIVVIQARNDLPPVLTAEVDDGERYLSANVLPNDQPGWNAALAGVGITPSFEWFHVAGSIWENCAKRPAGAR